MNVEDLQRAAIVAQHLNDDDVWGTSDFRFKTCDAIDKSALLRLRNSEIIRERDDAWSQKTWTWTSAGSTAVSMVQGSPITEASEEQLAALEQHADILLTLPRNDTFFAAEYALRGQNLQTLSEHGLIDKVGEESQLSVWSLSDFSLRVLTSLEAQQLRCDSGNEMAAVALCDD